ncbi:hypothetical protein [Clostridium sp.]|uniref:hypothetical protein n=1 Tax=Clostridium sp. TaxID=1506 RepID=UPI002FC761EC
MNSQGFIRGYMAKNMEPERFIEVVSEAIRKELNFSVEVNKGNVLYVINVNDKYNVEIPVALIKELIARSPYGVDKYILDKLIEMGKPVEQGRSQDLKYCYLE